MQQLLLLSPGCMHLLPEVQWSDQHTICWHGGSVCTFPSLPWALLPGNALISHPCAHLVTVCVIGTRKAPAMFFSPPTCVWHNVYSHLSARAMAAGVSILSDLPNSIGGARSGETSTEMEAGRRALHHTNNTGTTPAFYLARRWHRTELGVNFTSGWVFFNVGLQSIKIILILFSALIRKTDEWKCVWCTVCNRWMKWECVVWLFQNLLND